MNYELWHLTYKSLWLHYKRFKQFRIGSQGIDKRQLSGYIWKNNLKKLEYNKYSGKSSYISNWWYVKRKRLSKRYKEEDIFLFAPKTTQIRTPSIILKRKDADHLSLSAYHPRGT